MAGRRELTEEAWSATAPLLPRSEGRRGGQWRDHWTVINGNLLKLRTGAPWRDLPDCYGPWQTCADWLYRWCRDGRHRLHRHLAPIVIRQTDPCILVLSTEQYTKRCRSTRCGLGGRPQTQGLAWRLRCSVATRVT